MTTAIDHHSHCGPQVATPVEAQPPAPRPFSPFKYCLLLVLPPLFAIPALIALGSSNFFLHHGASVWVQANDKIFDARDQDCDVLVFGDSTAMTGIDPDKVEQQTGLKTCNIAVTNAVLAVTGNLTLDHFLAHNHRPRVLLVQLSPDDFLPENHRWHQTIYAEGMVELLRHGKPDEARAILLTHPGEAIAFAGYTAGFTTWYAIKAVWFHLTSIHSDEDAITVRNGFFTPPAPARTTCVPATSVLSPNNDEQIAFSRSLVANFQSSYSHRAGTVLVNVAPIPDCDQNLAAYRSDLTGITSNQLLAIPVGYFNNCCHYTAEGSEVVSTLVALEINTVASRNPSKPRVAILDSVRLRVTR